MVRLTCWVACRGTPILEMMVKRSAFVLSLVPEKQYDVSEFEIYLNLVPVFLHPPIEPRHIF